MTFVALQIGSGLTPDAAPTLAARDFDGSGSSVNFRSDWSRPLEQARVDYTNLSFDSFDNVLPLGIREFRPQPNVGDFGPRTNGLAGAFFNDGSDSDVRARTENFFLSNLPVGRVIFGDDPTSGYFLPPSIRDIPGEHGTIYGHIHRHTPSDTRADFTPTICWHPLVLTDARGEANVEFATSDAVTDLGRARRRPHGAGPGAPRPGDRALLYTAAAAHRCQAAR